jgi:hypothetical protein
MGCSWSWSYTLFTTNPVTSHRRILAFSCDVIKGSVVFLCMVAESMPNCALATLCSNQQHMTSQLQISMQFCRVSDVLCSLNRCPFPRQDLDVMALNYMFHVRITVVWDVTHR